MGTRADFYVGRGAQAEWLGSIAWDGHTGSVFDEAPEMFANPLPTEDEWRQWVARYLASRDDGTVPEDGWPWPWEDSRTTDYAYAWEDGAIWASCFGCSWYRVDPEAEYFGEPEEDDGLGKVAVFPDMSAHKAVTYGPRSGVMVISFGGPGSPVETGDAGPARITGGTS